MSLTTELGRALPPFSQGDVIVTSLLLEAKENLVPRTGLEKGSRRYYGGQSDPNTLEVLQARHQRVWIGQSSPNGDGDSSVPEVFNGGRGKERVTGMSGILALGLPLISPVTLGGLVFQLGTDWFALLSPQAPSCSNMM